MLFTYGSSRCFGILARSWFWHLPTFADFGKPLAYWSSHLWSSWSLRALSLINQEETTSTTFSWTKHGLLARTTRNADVVRHFNVCFRVDAP
ncbi:hypothetical protein J6590_074908 [Homalodisca vitripennis]|nr:hypothetical protein J6590_074908 [Homalodisca vitripennis]